MAAVQAPVSQEQQKGSTIKKGRPFSGALKSVSNAKRSGFWCSSKKQNGKQQQDKANGSDGSSKPEVNGNAHAGDGLAAVAATACSSIGFQQQQCKQSKISDSAGSNTNSSNSVLATEGLPAVTAADTSQAATSPASTAPAAGSGTACQLPLNQQQQTCPAGTAAAAPASAECSAVAAGLSTVQQQLQACVGITVSAADALPTATMSVAAAAAGLPGPPSAAELGPQRCRRVAEVLLRCGKPSEAAGWAEQALAASPWDVELLLLRGKCLEAINNVPGAFASYMLALSVCPKHVPCLFALASLYKAKGMLDEARVVLEKALQACKAAGSSSRSGNSSFAAGPATANAGTCSNQATVAGDSSAADKGHMQQQTMAVVDTPNDQNGNASSGASEVHVPVAAVREALAVVLTDLGTRAKTAGCPTDAEGLYCQALSLYPIYPSAHYNLGVLASEARQWQHALQHYKDTLSHAPHHIQALCNMGVVLRELQRLEEAVAAYEAALAVAPNYPIVRTNLAVALTDLGTGLKLKGQLQQGIAMYERALALVPRHADALYNLGVACAEAGQVERAVFCYEMTTHFNPACAEAWNNLGVLHKDADNLERAADCYMAALNIRPNFPQSLNNLAVVLTSQGKAGEAYSHLQAAIAASPDYAEAHNNLGVLQRDVGAIHDALASYGRALKLVPDSRNAGQNRLLALNYVYPGEGPLVCAAHAEWGHAFQAMHAEEMLPEVTSCDRDTSPGRPLKVGYVSPDLFTHSVSYFAEAPMSHHNPSRVQLFVYSCVVKQDAKTTRLQQKVVAAGGVWRDVARMSEPDLAKLIRQDQVDILVELTGHTANNRLGVCAMRAAPVQVTWIGYPNSTGLTAVDYRFTDAICDPTHTKQTYTEELVRLPGCFLCYTPAADCAPPVAPLPAATNGFVTFGSFNNLAKITPQVLALWARILNSVPASRLLLKAKPLSCAMARHHVMTQLQAAGVPAWKVDLLPLTPGTGEHLAVYGLMDISLDTFPYAGTTTTAESLYMGVPVITLRGGCHAHNVSCSLLSAVGLADQWVARDQEQYVQLAVQHASNIPALQQLRQQLRQQMATSQLCDAKIFVPQLEDTYSSLWQRWVTEGGRKRPIQGLLQQQQEQQRIGQQVQQQQQPGSACHAEQPMQQALQVHAAAAAAAAAAAGSPAAGRITDADDNTGSNISAATAAWSAPCAEAGLYTAAADGQGATEHSVALAGATAVMHLSSCGLEHKSAVINTGCDSGDTMQACVAAGGPNMELCE